MAPVWKMTVSKSDFVQAVKDATTSTTLRRKAKNKFEPEVTIAPCNGGVSVCSSYAEIDIGGKGSWPEAIIVGGASLRLLAPKLSGTEVVLIYSAGQMRLNGTILSAREA